MALLLGLLTKCKMKFNNIASDEVCWWADKQQCLQIRNHGNFINSTLRFLGLGLGQWQESISSGIARNTLEGKGIQEGERVRRIAVDMVHGHLQRMTMDDGLPKHLLLAPFEGRRPQEIDTFCQVLGAGTVINNGPDIDNGGGQGWIEAICSQCSSWTGGWLSCLTLQPNYPDRVKILIWKWMWISTVELLYNGTSRGKQNCAIIRKCSVRESFFIVAIIALIKRSCDENCFKSC